MCAEDIGGMEEDASPPTSRSTAPRTTYRPRLESLGTREAVEDGSTDLEAGREVWHFIAQTCSRTRRRGTSNRIFASFLMQSCVKVDNSSCARKRSHKIKYDMSSTRVSFVAPAGSCPPEGWISGRATDFDGDGDPQRRAPAPAPDALTHAPSTAAVWPSHVGRCVPASPKR